MIVSNLLTLQFSDSIMCYKGQFIWLNIINVNFFGWIPKHDCRGIDIESCFEFDYDQSLQYCLQLLARGSQMPCTIVVYSCTFSKLQMASYFSAMKTFVTCNTILIVQQVSQRSISNKKQSKVLLN